MDSVDPNLLPSYAKKLGLGVPTGLTDVAESPGLIPDPEWMRVNLARNWTYSDAVNMSIGQGQVQVTPLQIARLTSIVANGGFLYRPQLVKQVGIVGDVPSYTMQPEVMSDPGLSAEAIATVRQGMCAVTTNQTLGTAEFVFRDSDLQLIGVCGKTGTAEDPANLITHAWFTAYAPRENPEIAIAVIVENAGEGSGVAAPIVRRILEYYFFGTKT
jgi:penicillin-binding protein 2